MSDSTTPSAAHPEPAERDRDRLRASLLIGLCCFVIYNANLHSITAGDTYPARYLPFAMVQHHTVFLDPVAKLAAQGRGAGAYWMVHRPAGHIISIYPVVTPALVAPLYVPAVAYLHWKGWTDQRLDQVARIMEKLAASFVAALSASLLYLLLRRRATRSIALLLTIAYAFGTTTWAVSSQALWQHGMAELLVIGALIFLTGPSTAMRTIAAGLLLGLIAGNRPPDAILAAALGVYGLFFRTGRRRGALLIVSSAFPMLVVLLYNLAAAGNIGGGYGLIGKAQFFSHDLLPGIAGLVISPTRGLFVFSPFLLFLFLAWRFLPPSRDERALTVAMFIGIALQIVLYAKADWRGGMSWGSRYMTDFLPMLIWMLVPVVTALRGIALACFRIAVGVAIAFECIGAFWYVDNVDLPIFANDRGYEAQDMREVWKWRNAPYVTSLRGGLAPRELWIAKRGSFDGIETDVHGVTATGWALARHATPWQVAVSVDGRTFVTNTFTDRPDVRATMGETSPSGWRIPIDTSDLGPGEHAVTAFVWVSGRGEGYYLDEKKLVIAP